MVGRNKRQTKWDRSDIIFCLFYIYLAEVYLLLYPNPNAVHERSPENILAEINPYIYRMVFGNRSC